MVNFVVHWGNNVKNDLLEPNREILSNIEPNQTFEKKYYEFNTYTCMFPAYIPGFDENQIYLI